jgi:hypothetical protein
MQIFLIYHIMSLLLFYKIVGHLLLYFTLPFINTEN